MITRTIFFYFFFITVFVSKFSEGKPPSKIVQGSEAPTGTYPSIVSLRERNSHVCGGTLITKCHVLTAAHCLTGININSMIIGAGGTDQLAFKHYYRAQAFYIFPAYVGESNSHLHDIGIIRMSTCITEDPTQKVARIYPYELVPGTPGVVVGWGHLVHNAPATARYLQQVDTVTIDNSECLQSYPPTTVRPVHVCTIYGPGQGFCSGDSGGPLYVNGQIAAVVSMAVECGRNFPDLYTRLSHYRQWMNQVTSVS